jgi:hypothetical protein
VIYLHETYDVKPGKYGDLVRNVEREFLAIAESHNLRLVAFWETVLSQGEPPEAIALWELDNWTHFGRITEAQYPGASGGDKKFQQWNEAIWQWVDKRRGKVLMPGPSSPTLAQLKASKVSAKMCVHETLKIVPNLQQAYLEAVELQYYPMAHKHARREMVGYFRTFWRNCENVSIWSLMDGWSTLGLFDKPGLSDFQQRETKHWMNVALSLRTDWEERLLYAAPFSTL